MPQVSIVTPCYNAEKFISKAIDSFRNQTFTDWEHIIVDDGSTDNSAEIVSHYMQVETRLKLVKQSNRGLCITRNNGLKASSPWKLPKSMYHHCLLLPQSTRVDCT
jgi:glycosyltransferase involved in cell wall biosynthesis